METGGSLNNKGSSGETDVDMEKSASTFKYDLIYFIPLFVMPFRSRWSSSL
jgi:hypothetical protein